MSRRAVSPIRMTVRSDADPRDNMIRKLKEDLIVARGREQELQILQNYLVDLIEKTKLLSAETAKADQEGKLKLELTVKTINQLKKEVDILKAELRNTTIEMGEVEQEEDVLKKTLNSKLIQIEKLKKEGMSLHGDNEKLLNEHYRLRTQEDEMIHQIKKLGETIRDYEGRLTDFARKVLEVKSFINQMSEENLLLKEKLKNYQKENTGIGENLDEKQNHIDGLERAFAEKHELIKSQVEGYIELQHLNEKLMKETKHKLNLAKIENDKFNDLGSTIKKVERSIAERSKDLLQVKQQSDQIHKINQDFVNKNARLKQDLSACQQHLQNLLKHNAFIQQEMQNFVREDEAIISIICRKRIIPVNKNLNSLRNSRNQAIVNSRKNYK